jgi:uncharacterized protein YqjF (DUF2071 family)
VSLVAFTMRGLRFATGGRLTAWLTAPIATHELLNVRTYVKHRGEQAIYFMAEWIPNRLSVLMGPRTYGLPYRYGRLDYRHRHESGVIRGSVEPGSGGRLDWHASISPTTRFRPCETGSLSEFLLERYTAFTMAGRRLRQFHIRHEPWCQAPVDTVVHDDDALATTGPWYAAATLVASSYTPGVEGVLMGRPRRVSRVR